MKYKILKPHGGKGGVIRKPGDPDCEIDDKEAEILLRSRHIARVKQPVRKAPSKRKVK